MAINKKLIHFKNFSDFNSKKLSANENNTQYTLGINGTVTNGSPDILYQSICYIKDTKQQWTHGQLYDCSENASFLRIGDVDEEAVANFIALATGAVSADYYIAASNIQGAEVNGMITSLSYAGPSSSPVLASYTFYGSPSGGQFAHRLLKITSTLTISTGTVSTTYELTLDNKQNTLVSGDNIKTINGQSILASGNLNTNIPTIKYTSEVKIEPSSDHPWTLDTFGANVLAHEFDSGIGTIYFDMYPTLIGDYAFSGLPITSITIPDSVINIGDGAFSVCVSLETIILGKSVEYVGLYAFLNCGNLNKVVCKALVPPTISGACFSGISEKYEVCVPVESFESYKNDAVWGKLTEYLYGVTFTNEFIKLSDYYLPLTGGSMTGPLTFTDNPKINSLGVKSLDLHRPVKLVLLQGNQEIVGIKQGIITNKVFDYNFTSAFELGATFGLKLIYEDEECITIFKRSIGDVIEDTSQEIINRLKSGISYLYNNAANSHIKDFAKNLSVECYGDTGNTINIINKGNFDDVQLEFSIDGNVLDSFDVYDKKFVFDIDETLSYGMILGHPFLPLGFTQYTLDAEQASADGCDFTYQYLSEKFTKAFHNNLTNRPIAGKSEGIFSIYESSDVNITGTVETAETLKSAPILEAKNNTLSISVGGQAGYVNIPFGDEGSRLYYCGNSSPTSLTAFGDAEIVGDHIAEYGFFEGTTGIRLRYLQFSKPVTSIPSNAFTTSCTSIWIPPTVNSIASDAFTTSINYIYADHYVGDITWCIKNSKLQSCIVTCGKEAIQSYSYPWFLACPYAQQVTSFIKGINFKNRDPYLLRNNPCQFVGTNAILGISNYTVQYSQAINGRSYSLYPPQIGTIIFTTGTTVPSITYIGTIKWANGTVPTLQPSKTYEMSFYRGLGVCVEY